MLICLERFTSHNTSKSICQKSYKKIAMFIHLMKITLRGSYKRGFACTISYKNLIWKHTVVGFCFICRLTGYGQTSALQTLLQISMAEGDIMSKHKFYKKGEHLLMTALEYSSVTLWHSKLNCMLSWCQVTLYTLSKSMTNWVKKRKLGFAHFMRTPDHA